MTNPGIDVGLTILAAGRGWLAVDKPAGLSVHNAPGADLVSLAAGQISVDPALQAQLAWDGHGGVRAAHRLDQDTGGVVVLACSDRAAQWLGLQFQQGKVRKQYAALVHGRMDPLGPDQWGRWTWPLSKGPGGRKDPAGPGPKVPCTTAFRVVDQSRHYSLLACEPVTGRQHQIRRHACLAGHPVVGDRRYAPLRALRYLEGIGFTGLALHARRLTFQPPDQDGPLTVQTAGLPAAMAKLLEADKG